MTKKTEMVRIRCTPETKKELIDFTHDKAFKNLEDSLVFLMEYYNRTHHLTTGKVY